MTLHDWMHQWKRLEAFRVSGEANRSDVAAEWFRHLQHYHVDAVEAGITALIGQATDTFLPGLGVLKGHIQQRLDRYARTPGTCETCHGATWIDAWPWWSNGQVYTGLQRCPDCGVPAPEVHASHRTPLTPAEYAAWQAGTLAQPPILTAPANTSALEALRALRATRGKLAQAVSDVPKKAGAA